MNISILLPYKENFSPEYPGAVSLFVYETTRISRFKKDITVYGNTSFKKKFNLKYKNIELNKRPFSSQTKNYVKKFIDLEKINNSTIIEKLLDSTGSNLKDPIKRDRYARLFNNKKHLRGALNFMAETDVMSVLQNVHSAKTKFFFIIGARDTWVRPDNLKNIFSKYFPQAKILELDGGHLLNETHAKELCKLILQELTYRGNSI